MLIKLVKIAHYTDAVFKVVGSNAKVRRRHATFSENAPFWRRHSDRRFAVECHLVTDKSTSFKFNVGHVRVTWVFCGK